MIPYFSIITGYGAGWLENIFQKEGLVKNVLISRLCIAVLSIFTSTLMFLHAWTSFMILPGQRYAQMAQEVAPRLEPMSNAVVYVNLKGDFEAWEFAKSAGPLSKIFF